MSAGNWLGLVRRKLIMVEVIIECATDLHGKCIFFVGVRTFSRCYRGK